MNVAEMTLLLNKLQELSMAKLRPDFSSNHLPSHAMSSVRLALASNLARAILGDP
jgi:nuclear pore complex protein Nup85